MSKIFITIKKDKGFLLKILACTISLYLVFISPSLCLKMGNIFFFKIPALYNASFANYFYTYAAYPPFGTSEPWAHHQLSRVLFIQGYLQQSKTEALLEIELYPTHTQTYYLLGLTYGYLQKEKLAIDAFSMFIQSHPDTWAGRNDKAWLQFRIGDIDGAYETIKPVVDSQKYNPWVQNTYCAILINVNKIQEAKDSCERANKTLETIPENIWGKAYPGNDPRIYGEGLQATKDSVSQNLLLIKQSNTSQQKK